MTSGILLILIGLMSWGAVHLIPSETRTTRVLDVLLSTIATASTATGVFLLMGA